MADGGRADIQDKHLTWIIDSGYVGTKLSVSIHWQPRDYHGNITADYWVDRTLYDADDDYFRGYEYCEGSWDTGKDNIGGIGPWSWTNSAITEVVLKEESYQKVDVVTFSVEFRDLGTRTEISGTEGRVSVGVNVGYMSQIARLCGGESIVSVSEIADKSYWIYKRMDGNGATIELDSCLDPEYLTINGRYADYSSPVIVLWFEKATEQIGSLVSSLGDDCGQSAGRVEVTPSSNIKAGESGTMAAVESCCFKFVRWTYGGFEEHDPHGINNLTDKSVTIVGRPREYSDYDGCYKPVSSLYRAIFDRCGMTGSSIIADSNGNPMYKCSGNLIYGQIDSTCSCTCGQSSRNSKVEIKTEAVSVVSVDDDCARFNILI